MAQLHQRLGLQDRDRIFQLEPTEIDRTGFDGERCGMVAYDADPDRRLRGGGQIGLSDGLPTCHELLPAIAGY
jgi:hypothetical protein